MLGLPVLLPIRSESPAAHAARPAAQLQAFGLSGHVLMIKLNGRLIERRYDFLLKNGASGGPCRVCGQRIAGGAAAPYD